MADLVPPPMWDREDLQRVLYHVVVEWLSMSDSELMRSAIYDVAIPTLLDNGWWPADRSIPTATRNGLYRRPPFPKEGDRS